MLSFNFSAGVWHVLCDMCGKKSPAAKADPEGLLGEPFQRQQKDQTDNWQMSLRLKKKKINYKDLGLIFVVG